MGKYDFRMDGELERQFISLMKTLHIKKSALLRDCVEKGMSAIVEEVALTRLRFDQTHGFEITKFPHRPSTAPLYQDIKGFYHIPFDILQEGAVLRDIIDMRDGKKCRKCGNGKGEVDYHYIDGDESNQTLENIITLCRKCEKETNEFIPKKYRKLLFAVWFYMIGQEPRVFSRKT